MDIGIHAPRERSERKKYVLFLLRFANGSVMVCYVSTKKSVMVCYGNMRICYGLLRERENLLWFVVQNPLLFLLRNQKIPVMVCYGYTKICYSCYALLVGGCTVVSRKASKISGNSELNNYFPAFEFRNRLKINI